MVFAMKFDITCGCLDIIFIFVFLKILYNNLHLCVYGIKQPLEWIPLQKMQKYTSTTLAN